MDQILYCLVYASSANVRIGEEELEAILEVSRKNNPAMDITGILLYSEGNFIQVLEGPKENVFSLYEKLCEDHRHRGLTMMVSEPIEERNFSEWTMGFKRIGRPDREYLEGWNELLQTRSYEGEELAQCSPLVLKLLKAFRKVVNA